MNEHQSHCATLWLPGIAEIIPVCDAFLFSMTYPVFTYRLSFQDDTPVEHSPEATPHSICLKSRHRVGLAPLVTDNCLMKHGEPIGGAVMKSCVFTLTLVTARK